MVKQIKYTEKPKLPYEAATNVLIALAQALAHDSCKLVKDGNKNSLEYFVKDIFCPDAVSYTSISTKIKSYYKYYLSWDGLNEKGRHSSNFPDMVIKGPNGAGVESKAEKDKTKVKSKKNSNPLDKWGIIDLNSSYPKDYVRPNTQNYPEKSLEKEPGYDKVNQKSAWTKKPIIYAIGNYRPGTIDITYLWLVYGSLMVPNNQYYLNIINQLQKAIRSVSHKNKNINLNNNSVELGHAYGIDKLTYTNLRARGMYELIHPIRIFDNQIQSIPDKDPKREKTTKIIVAIPKSELINIEKDMKKQGKWNSLKAELDKDRQKGILYKKATTVTDPNNLSKTINAVFFVGYTHIR